MKQVKKTANNDEEKSSVKSVSGTFFFTFFLWNIKKNKVKVKKEKENDNDSNCMV